MVDKVLKECRVSCSHWAKVLPPLKYCNYNFDVSAHTILHYMHLIAVITLHIQTKFCSDFAGLNVVTFKHNESKKKDAHTKLIKYEI